MLFNVFHSLTAILSVCTNTRIALFGDRKRISLCAVKWNMAGCTDASSRWRDKASFFSLHFAAHHLARQ